MIDGNNVIGQRVGWHRDKPGSRRRLLRDLARLARAKRLRQTVVFDGAPDPQFPDGSSYCGVRILYSHPGSDADSRIIEMVEAERNRKNLVVVTSDRKLAAIVRSSGVRVMRSGEFRKMIDETAGEAPADETPMVRDDDLNEWLRYFGVDGDDDE